MILTPCSHEKHDGKNSMFNGSTPFLGSYLDDAEDALAAFKVSTSDLGAAGCSPNTVQTVQRTYLPAEVEEPYSPIDYPIGTPGYGSYKVT